MRKKNFSFIFEEFKKEDAWMRFTPLIVYLRSIVEPILIVVFYDYPIIQITLLLTISCFYSLNMGWKRPRESRLLNSFEIIANTVLSVVLISCYQFLNQPNFFVLGNVCIWIIFAVEVYQTIIILHDYYKNMKEWKEKWKKYWENKRESVKEEEKLNELPPEENIPSPLKFKQLSMPGRKKSRSNTLTAIGILNSFSTPSSRSEKEAFNFQISQYNSSPRKEDSSSKRRFQDSNTYVEESKLNYSERI